MSSVTNPRTFGVRGENLQAKRNPVVRQANFAIGGLIGDSERKYNQAFKITSPEEFSLIFGGQINSGDYLPDNVKSFFDNVGNIAAELYVQSFVGYDTGGDVIDAVVASRDKADAGADTNAYVVQAAYQEYLEYGTSGNRTGTKFVSATRFSTQAAANVAATGVSSATLDSVIGIKVGDIILFTTNAGADPVYKKVTAVDESAKTVSWSGDFEVSGASGETLTTNDPVTIPGFQVKTYRKSTNGVEVEVDVELGKVICSSESEVTDFYVENIFAVSNYVKITEASASTLGDRLPVADSVVTYPTTGANGTAVATSEAVEAFLPNFDDLPIRFLGDPEHTATDINESLITYSLSRTDNPIILINGPENQTKAQLIVIGQTYQSSSYKPAVYVEKWLKVADPFSNSATGKNERTIPSIGDVMGEWISTIDRLGIHWVPASNRSILSGKLGVVGTEFADDDDRTDLGAAGVNTIRQIDGVGIKIMNFRTVSTDSAYVFANIILMRNFIKVSAEDSLSDEENTPNSFNRVEAQRLALEIFMRGLWKRGSTGNAPEGETFGQTIDSAGTRSEFEDSVQVIGDATNNPQSQLDLGERDYAIYFSGPAPTESIVVGVGVLLRS